MKKVPSLVMKSSLLTTACYALKRNALFVILIFNAFLISAQTNCPNAGIFLNIQDICAGEDLPLEVIRMTDMDSLDNGASDFGVTFVSFPGTSVPADPYIGGDSLTTVTREGLTGGGDGFYGASTTGGSDLTPNSYVICTILEPIPSDPACRPTNCQLVNILSGPVVTFVAPPDVCERSPVLSLITGNPFGGMYSGVGVQDDGRGGFEFNPILSGVGVHTISYTYSNRDGCSTTVMDDIEVFANPIVTISDPDDRCTGGADAVFVGGPNATGNFDSDATTGFTDNNDGTATLDVSVAGVGTYTVNYNYVDDNGCTGTASTEISVCESPCPDLDLFADLPDLCEFEEINLIIDRMTLLDSLDNQEEDYGILFTTFVGSTTPADPYTGGDSLTLVERGDIMGGADGFYNLNTTVTNSLTAGSYSICATLNPVPGDPACRPFLCQQISILPAPMVAFTGPADLCDDDMPVSLDTGSPAGGNYSGTGVQPDGRGGFEFSPVLAGGGLHIISYEITNRDGCSNTAMDTIMVFPLPMLNITVPATTCENIPAFGLNENPTGGTFSGNGIVGNNFDPAVAGVGIHTITYDFMDANNCSNTTSGTIEVFAAPMVSLSALADLCIDGGVQMNLTGGIPTGGTYSGPGVINNMDGTYNFDPATAGAGTHTIEYTFTDGNGCEDIATDVVEVSDLPTVTLVGPADLCIDAGIQSSIGGGTPVGGIYNGNGVVDDGNGSTFTFDPTSAGVGTHTITYTYATPDSMEVFDNIGFDEITLSVISDVNSTAIAADDFMLTTDQDIINIEWSGVYANSTPTAPDDFTIIIYSDGGGMPGTILNTISVGDNVNRTDTGVDDSALNIYSYNVSIPAFSTTAGTVYWLSIFNSTASGGTWAWSRRGGGGNAIASFDQGATWTLSLGGEIDFRLAASAVSCTNTATDSIEVFAIPVVSFTALSDLCIDGGVQMNLGGGIPTGGTFSGTGVVDNGDGTYNFDPSTAGVGTYTIEYLFTDGNGCDDLATDMVEVFALPVVSFTALSDLCVDGGVQMNLGGGSPTGGTFSGDGVVDNGDGTYNFDPSSAGVGTHTITYNFGDGNGCDDTATDMVEVFALPVVSFTALSDLCVDAGVQMNLGGGSPTGGTFSGPGVVDNGDGTYNFDPSTAGAGMHTIEYLFTDGNGCDDMATDMVEVFAIPVVSFTALSDLCIDAGVQMNLGGGSPTGGTFSGSGVVDNGDGTYSFDPSTAGVGTHTIEYLFTDGNGCDDVVTDMVEVFATPVVSFTALSDLCENVGVQMNITGGSPMGGSFSGPGVIDNGDGTYNFNPATAGVGIHTIVYSFTDGNGCDDMSTDMVEVLEAPVVNFTTLSDLCIDAGIQLNIGGGNPVGGIYSGSGVTDNGDGTYNFDPVTATIGVHTIEYTFSNSNGCENTVSDMVEVFNLPMVTETHQDISECTGLTNGSIDLTVAGGGTFSFDWATVDGSGIVAGNEDQNSLSAGQYMVTVTNTATSCSATLVIDIIEGTDLVAPMINCPSDITISCVDDSSVAALGMATATDNCDPNPMISFVDNSELTGCSGTGQIIRTWTAVDSSSNRTTCEQIIMIVDNDPPVFDMLSTLDVVSCPQNIPAPIALTAVDECTGPITLMPDITTVDQTCANEFTRVYTYNFVDDCGNETIFTKSYQVVTSPPTLVTSPPDYTVACELDIILYPHLVTVNSSCDGPLQITSVLNGPFGAAGCSGSTYEAVYSWTDGCYMDSVVQVYTLENEGPEFVCPPDICIIDCFADNDMIQNQFDDYSGLATVNTSCSSSEVTITNDFSGDNFISNNCGTGSIAFPNTLEYQIVTFTATDACNRSTTCTALVVIVDGTPPEFNGTPVVGIAGCGSDVQTTYDNWVNTQIARLDANDVCGDNGMVNVTYSPQSPTISTGNTSVTPVTFTANDGCGNSRSITVSFVVEDEGGPAFAAIPEDDMILCDELPVVFGNVMLSENCSPATVTFEDTFISGDVNSCDNQEVSILQRIWTATDAAGNTATASQQITIIPGRANVAGTIITAENEFVSDVNLAVYRNSDMMEEQTTLETGTYEFELPVQENYEIVATRNDHPLNGITTYDLVLLGQHLLEINTLESPYQLIAADVNNSGSVTALDMIALRRMILVIDTAFPNNESWRFIDADYLFPNSDNPFSSTFPESHTINGLSGDLVKDFIAVKTGDLNQSAIPNNLLEGDTREDHPSWVLEMQDEPIYQGQSYEIPVTVQENGTLNGFQYTLTFDAELVNVQSIAAGNLKGMNANNFGVHALNEGWLTTSWHQPYPVKINAGDTLFTISFTANQNIGLNKLFSINSLKTPAEMYSGSQILTPSLYFNTSEEYKVYQNVPNPFLRSTNIGFEQPEAGTVKLTIFDVNGKEIYRTQSVFEKGYQAFELQRKDLNTSGILFYKIDFKNYSNVKKMILIE